MEHNILGMVALVCGTLLLVTILVIVGWVKREQQRTFQKMLEKGDLSRDELMGLISPDRHYDRDFRRGALLIGLGLTLGVIFFLLGGIGWILAGIPIVAGLIYLLFWRLNVSKN